MTFQTRGGFQGLVTAVAETSAAPGALRIADNVVCRKRGVLEPRPAYTASTSGAWQLQTHTYLAAHPHGASTLFETNNGVLNESGTPMQFSLATGSAVTPQRVRRDIRDSVMARGNLYVPYSSGVCVLETPSSSAFRLAGLPVQYLGVSGTSLIQSGSHTPLLPVGQQVSYRLVARKTDSNGLVLRSRPTGAINVSYPAGGVTANPQLVVQIAAVGMFDAIEVYRTRMFPTTVSVDDEMQLVGTINIVGSTVSYVFVDQTPDAQRGTTLYTSPSRGGIENANDRPPAAACAAAFKQSVFYGNITGPQRIVVSHPWNPSIATGTLAGVGVRRPEVSMTAGSSTVTVTGSTLGLERGMVYSGGEFPAGTWITAISGQTLTMNQAAVSTVANVNAPFWDAIEINGAWHMVGSGGRLATSLQASNATRTSMGSYELTPPQAGYGVTHVIESVLRNYPTFTLRATHGGEYSPPLPKYAETTTAVGTTKQDVLPHGIVWSSPDEPEHVPPRYSALVGDKSKAILALAPTRDALYVLKEDGVWSLTGVNGNFTISPLDPTTRCALPSSVRGLNGRVYFLSNKGLVAIEDGSITVVSEPIRDEMAAIVDHVRVRHEVSGFHEYQFFTGVTSAVDDRNGEYLLALPPSMPILPSFGGQVLVFNALSEAFTTYTFQSDLLGNFGTPTGLGVSARGTPLVLRAGGVRQQTEGVGEAALLAKRYRRFSDDAITGITGTLGGTPLTFNGAPAYYWTAGQNVTTTPGDVLVGPNGAARVLQQLNVVLLVVDRDPGSPVTQYRPLGCTIEPQGYATPELTGKVWSHAVWALSRMTGAVTATARFSSATPSVIETAQLTREAIPLPTVSGEAGHYAGTLLRVNVPLVHRRGWLLRVGLELLVSYGELMLELVSADHRDDLPQKTQTHSTGAL